MLTKFDYEEELLINFSNRELDDLESEIRDRAYWDENSSKESLEVLDECLRIINEFEPKLSLNYTQSYVGLTQGLKRRNFVIFIPKQTFIRAEIHVVENESWSKKLESSDFTVNSIGKSIGKRGRIKFRISKEDVFSKRNILKDLFENSYGDWV